MRNKINKILIVSILIISSVANTVYAAPGDALTGTADISGIVVFGEELTATYTPGNNTGTLSYQWVRGSSDIQDAVSDKYTLVEADVGEQISVRIESDVESGSVTSTQTVAVDKADCETAKGVIPVYNSKTDISITVDIVAGYEYIIVENDALISSGTWQDSNIFTSLDPNTSYDIYQRVKETNTHKASAVSDKLDEFTIPSILDGTASITGTAVFGEELTAAYTPGNNSGTLQYQWIRGASDISGAISDKYTLIVDDIGEQISVRITSTVETGSVVSGQTTTVLKATPTPIKGITPVILTIDADEIVVDTVAGYEYIIVADGADVSTGTWQDIASFYPISSNTPYDIYQRVKETATHYASAVSDKLDATTAPDQLTGTATVSGTEVYGEELTATYTPGNNTGTLQYQWVRGSTDITGATSDKYTLVEEDIGQLISVKISSTVEGFYLTSNQTGAIAKADSTVSPVADPILVSKTGTTITVAAVAGYEYIRVADGALVSSGVWQDNNEFSGLSENTQYDIYQRSKETATHLASATSNLLDVTTDVTLTGTASVSGTEVYGEELTAVYTPGNNSGTLQYQWVRGADDIIGATGDKYTLTENDIGQLISVKISSTVEAGTLTSSQTGVIAKADNTTSPIVDPVLESKTDTTITVTAVAGYEYIIVADGALVSSGVWQDSNEFTGLTANTAYDIYQRVKETATHLVSATSNLLDATTENEALTGTAQISGTTIVASTLTASLTGGNNTGTLAYQWMRGGVDIPSAVNSTYILVIDDIDQQISVKISSDVQTGSLTSAETSAIEKQDCIIAKGDTPTLESKSSSTVTLTSVADYEYKVVADGEASTAGTWQDSNVFTGLSGNTAYDFYQRVKETLAQKPSETSDKLDVTTDVSSALTGTASISGNTIYGSTLTASLSSTNNTGTLKYQWVRGTTDIASATSSTYVLAAADIGSQIKVKISSTEETGVITSVATAAITKASSSPSKGVTPVLSSKTRHSVTLKYFAGYEYKVVANGASSSTGTWQSSSYFSDLSSGTNYDFYQRVKETSTNYASSISDKLDIKTYSYSSSTTASPKPTASPTPTVTLIPTATATPNITATPAPTATATPVPSVNVYVTPQAVKEDSKNGTVVVEIKTTDLPYGTKSIKTSDDRLIKINGDESIYVTVDSKDINNGMLELITLDEEGVALGAISMNVAEYLEEDNNPVMPFWLKIVLAVLIGAFVFTGVYVIIIRRRNYGY